MVQFLKLKITPIPRVLVLIMFVCVLLTNLLEPIPATSEDLNSNLNPESIYPKLGVIVDFDFNEDSVSVMDWNGDVWSFYGIDDWSLLDYVNMVFYDNDTPDNIYDDVIVNVSYERVDLIWAQVLERI